MSILKFQRPEIDRASKDELVIDTKKRNGERYCRHLRVLIDTKDRSVTCKSCGQALTAFEYLAALASDQSIAWSNAQRLREEADATAKRLEDLKRQERNAKARLKRLEAKIDGPF